MTHSLRNKSMGLFATLIILMMPVAGCAQPTEKDESLWYMSRAFFVPDANIPEAQIPDTFVPPEALQLPEYMSINKVKVEAPSGAISLTEITSPTQRPLIFYCGGSGYRTSWVGGYYAAELLQFGDVILMDYPGYGESEGDGKRESFVPAARAAFMYAQEKANAEGRPLVLWGMSLGGIVCPYALTYAAPIDLIVLETPSIRHSSVQNPVRTPHPQIAAINGNAKKGLILAASRDAEPVRAFRMLGDKLSSSGVPTETLEFDAAHGKVLFLDELEERVFPYFEELSHIK